MAGSGQTSWLSPIYKQAMREDAVWLGALVYENER